MYVDFLNGLDCGIENVDILIEQDIPKENPNVHSNSSSDERSKDGDANFDDSFEDIDNDDGPEHNMYVPNMHLDQVIKNITTYEGRSREL
ncbi:hypothetical protein L6452_15061 [Arctium lappa]|uniref:Uncharacterized protein n=1 Tax=Arctium lappa TaxID=4217 RepID=A0ACB9CMS5_ARCLA|nr:hypothetical protein L6452_15061 [Arctium lappa]